MVAYLTKSNASKGFHQIIDFLNGSTIKYALTVNPNIYVSCIKRFWTTVAVKKVNDVIWLQALVDKKKVVVTEAIIREVLRLDDAEGVKCFPNKEIFTEFARMGYEKPSTKLTLVRNVDSPSKFYMYPHFLQLMIRKQVGKGFSGVETPLFEGMLVAQEVVEEGDAEVHAEEVNAGDATEGDVSAANDEVPTADKEPSIPSPTPPTPPPQPSQDILSTSKAQPTHHNHLRVKKLEGGNKVKVLKLRRLQKVGTTQRVETSDETMMDDVSNQERMIAEMDQDADVVLEDDKEVADDVKDVQVNADIQGRTAESQAKIYKIDLDHANKVLSMQEDETEPAEVQEVVDVVTTANIITKVVTAASETITAASTNITDVEAQVPAVTLTDAPARVTVAPSRKRKGVVIRDPQEESTTSTVIPTKTKSKDKGKGILVEEPKPLKKQAQIKQDEKYASELEAELNKTIDWDEPINHVKKKAKEDPIVKRYQVLKRKTRTEAQARKNMMVYLKNVDGFKMDYFKGMSYDDIRPIFEDKFNTNVAFLQKTKEQIEEEENRALKRLNETLAEKASKRQKLDEEVEELKRHLQIVPNKDDDVYTEATPLARKVPVVGYEIIEQNNKPYYKIIRANGTHQLYVSFLTLLRNFDREDLEALWSLVKERFSTTKPKNFSDDFLLVTLGAMFEKPDIHAQIWKNQRSVHCPAKVKGWKLLESCGVHIVTFTTTQLILLVERNYLLTKFTLDQMLNVVRLEVEEESEVSLELIRALVKKSHNKTPYELLNDRTPRLNFMRIFGCPVTILNTLDLLEKFKGKADKGFLVGYSVTSKAFRVFNTKTRKAKENLHVRFLENKPNVAGTGPNWLFDIDSLTNSMNYIPVSTGNQTDKNAGPQDTNSNTDDKAADDKPKDDISSKTVKEPFNKEYQAYRDKLNRLMSQEKEVSDAADALRKEFDQ
uniref:Retroviral polymerase SH3-like domain-containing protein n=1 Tax=Tanacetum cinerariifolium TaxID=118510 RepID=A0A6L2K0W0_TANCI|nr:hypothetical protein [Tanacetum cinerariifolium]